MAMILPAAPGRQFFGERGFNVNTCRKGVSARADGRDQQPHQAGRMTLPPKSAEASGQRVIVESVDEDGRTFRSLVK